MDLTDLHHRLIVALTDGLPLTPRPYRDLGLRVALDEEQVLAGLRDLLDKGILKRLGLVVRHRRLGYRANGMVVWDVPDNQVAQVGRAFGEFEFVTLCYRRPRHPPQWPYNLFCMVHGQRRETVLAQVEDMARDCSVRHLPREVLFSARCFRQRGAIYSPLPEAAE